MAGRSYAWQLLRTREADGERLSSADVIKRSACIEGARMAFARCKMWWAKMDAVEVASGSLEGKEHRTPERYFADVLEGSRLVAAQCSQDIVFE